MAKRVVLSLLLSAFLLPSSSGASPQSNMQEWKQQADGQVQRLWEQLKADYGFGYAGEIVLGALDADDDEYFEFAFVPHREYVITGFCDGDCGDLDLLLYDRDDNVIMDDIEPDAEPVLRIPTGYEGVHYIEASMVTCSVEPCFYAVQVFHRHPEEQP